MQSGRGDSSWSEHPSVADIEQIAARVKSMAAKNVVLQFPTDMLNMAEHYTQHLHQLLLKQHNSQVSVQVSSRFSHAEFIKST